ncbi:MAG: thiol-activated cytolysin family protein [Planctomycetota bacterium]|jgi:thiol-activated cytolysin
MKKLLLLILFLAVSFVFIAFGCKQKENKISNTQYIQSLEYDLNELLAVDLTPKAIDLSDVGESRDRLPGEVIIVTKKKHDASSHLTESALLNPGAGVVFPGAVLKQDNTLAEGVPTPYTFPRGPLTIHVDLPGLEDKAVAIIQSPTNVNVNVEIQKITDYWLDNVKDKQGYQPPIRAFSDSHKAYTKGQIGIECGFGAQWGNCQATASLKVESTDEQTIVYRAFKQIYYSVSVQEPEEAGDMFAKKVKLDSKNMPAMQPPGFVRNVDYGRIIIVQMTTTEKVTEQEAEATLQYKSLGQGVDLDLKEHYEKIARNSLFKALVLGGGGASAEVLGGNIEEMNKIITEGIEFSKDSPAYPISYMVADLKTRATSRMNTSTSYIETVREVLPNRSITLHHKGAFVAHFYVHWLEFDDAQNKYVEKSWDSGNKTAPYEHLLPFPGDARRFTIEGRYAVFIKTWRSKWLSYEVLDGNYYITLSGTTLNSSMTGKKL